MPNSKKNYEAALKRYNELLEKVGRTGFPPEPLHAFYGNTNISNKPYKSQIIMSRVPGGATTQLIKEGYDTKGFLIKSKSCDWGPMAGFVCKLPPLNKAGYSKINYNYENTEYFLKKCKAVQEKAKNDPHPQLNVGNTSPFRQIRITKKRLDEISGVGKFNIISLKEVGTDKAFYFGTASNEQDIKKSTVVIEFLLEKENDGKTNETFYKLYHGKILIREKTSTGWVDYDEFRRKKGEENIIWRYSRPIKPFNQLQELINKERKNNQYTEIFGSTEGLKFYELEGICNLDSFMTTMEHKSTVTGDYDLFAIWPVFEKSIHDSFGYIYRIFETRNILMRLAESNHSKVSSKKNKTVSLIGPVFSSFINYTNALQVVIQFIPHFKEIDDLESPDLGNYNSIGIDCVDGINSSISDKNLRYKRAHHSDEGGRPGINLLDLPVMAFYPEQYLEDKKFPTTNTHDELGIYLIDTPGVFVRHCKGLADKFTRDLKSQEKVIPECPLVLNHAWLLNLIAYTMTDVELHEIGNTLFHGDTKQLNKFDKFCNEVSEQKASDLRNNTTITINDLKDAFFPILPRVNNINVETFFKDLIEILIKYTFSPTKSAITVKQEFDDLISENTGIRP